MKTFTFCRRGYDPAEVDPYIQELQAVINNQAAKLSAFQEKEAAINRSVIDAQLLAEDIHSKALTEATELRQKTLDELGDIKNQVLALHQKLLAFQSEYTRILQQYLVSLRCEEMTSLFKDIDSFMKKLDMDVPPQEETAVELTDMGM